MVCGPIFFGGKGTVSPDPHNPNARRFIIPIPMWSLFWRSSNSIAELESSLALHELLVWIAGGLVLLGVVLEVVADRHIFTNEWLKKWGEYCLIAGLVGEIGFGIATAVLSGLIVGKLEKQSTDALERASAADLARVKLEASMMWRHLSAKQTQVLCATLSPRRANQSMIISSSQDPEAFGYANEFAAELRRCEISGGFNPNGHLGNSYWSSNVVFGVWIKVSKNPNWDIGLAERRRMAERLRDFLTDSGVKIAGISTNEASGLFDIYVGPRFPPHAEELASSNSP